MNKEQLAQNWGHQRNSDGCCKCANEAEKDFLTSQTRLRLLFEGDSESYRIARHVRVRLTHGIENSGALLPKAAKVLVQTARYLRTAILRLSGVDAQTLTSLLSPAYLQPLGPLKVVKYLRGQLSTSGSFSQHPLREWKAPKISRVAREDDGYVIHANENLGPLLGDATEFTVKSQRLEVWDGGRHIHAQGG